MDKKKIKEFIDLARAEGLSELKYETKDLKIAISFPKVEYQRAAEYIAMPPTSSDVGKASSPLKNNTASSLHTINSPFVGTLYLSSSPGKPPFVKVGDKVKKGDTLCILEAMKIMNEIESDIDGVVEEICEENESLVEYGRPLFRIKP